MSRRVGETKRISRISSVFRYAALLYDQASVLLGHMLDATTSRFTVSVLTGWIFNAQRAGAGCGQTVYSASCPSPRRDNVAARPALRQHGWRVSDRKRSV